MSTFLDALAALGDRERIETEAPKWLQAGTFAEPFALRALGAGLAQDKYVASATPGLTLAGASRPEPWPWKWHGRWTLPVLARCRLPGWRTSAHPEPLAAEIAVQLPPEHSMPMVRPR